MSGVLDALGLDPVAEKVYVTMLANPDIGISGLTAALSLTSDEIRSALDQLVELSLVRPSRENVGRLRPVDPETGLSALLARHQEALETRRREIEASHAEAARLIAAHTLQRPSSTAGDTEHLIGLDAIQERLNELLARAQEEVMSLVPGGAVPAEALEAAMAADSDLMRKKVHTRVLYQDAVRNDPTTMTYGAWMTGNGFEVRTTPVLPQRLLIVDRRAALVPLNPADPSSGAVHTANPGLVAQLAVLFERFWVDATPLAHPRPVEPGTGLTPVERELLTMLGTGATDEATAKRLGVSDRTVRRMMADLMARLGAASRFEAGLKAAKKGWL